jgi:hypothetical protein
MPRLAIILAVVAASCIAAEAAPIWQTSDAALLGACDEAIQERLKAPSTYERVNSTEFERRPATLDDFMGWTKPEMELQARALAIHNQRYAEALKLQMDAFRIGEYDLIESVIQYDADNAFGTPIRSTATCSDVINRGATFEQFGPIGPRINGQTNLDWAAGR